jgi:putative membrane protein
MIEQFSMINLIDAIVYAFLGIAIFVASFFLVDKLTPYDLWSELVNQKNVALAIVVGAMAIGMCIIIAAAVH